MPIGRPRRCAQGGDVTIVALSRMVHEALAAAERLAAEDGIEAEVIDPRTLVPLDRDGDRRIGRRTDRLVVAHEAGRHGGFGAEIAAAGAGGGVRRPRRPVGRVGAPFPPIPLSPPLEDAYLPGADDIAAAVRATLYRSNGTPPRPARPPGSGPRPSRRS